LISSASRIGDGEAEQPVVGLAVVVQPPTAGSVGSREGVVLLRNGWAAQKGGPTRSVRSYSLRGERGQADGWNDSIPADNIPTSIVRPLVGISPFRRRWCWTTATAIPDPLANEL
jgi:hypothetical protein